MTGAARIALVGDFSDEVLAHRAIPGAMSLSATAIGAEVEGEWVRTAELSPDVPAQL